MAEENTQPTENQANQPVFDIVRIYAKDCSLETPNLPAIFREQWKPQINVEFDTKPQDAGDNQIEVDLRVTVTCHNNDKVAFICEVHQAGLFLLKNLDKNTAEYLLSATAPNILFPYAREHIASLINRATFPALNLRPLNFEALYRARKMEEAQKQQGDNAAVNGASKDETPQA